MKCITLSLLVFTTSVAFTMQKPPQLTMAYRLVKRPSSADNSRINQDCCIKTIMDPAVVGSGVVAFWANHYCGINAGCSCLVGATTTLCALVYASDQNDGLSHHYYSTRLINHAKSKFFDVFPCMAARFKEKSE